MQGKLSAIASGQQDRELHEAEVRIPDLKARLDAYLGVGGFPQAVEAHRAGRTDSGSFPRELWDVVAQEIDRVGRDRATAIQILERVNASLGSAMSWTKLAEDIGVASAATAEQYVEALTEAFLLLPLYSLDRHKRRAALRKQKKLYVLDPAVAAIPPAVRPGSRAAPQPALLEGVIGSALYATQEIAILESVGFPQNLYYWRSTKDREVDFVVLDGGSEVAVEVKTSPSGHDRSRIRKAFGTGIIVSRGILDLDDPVKIVPAELLLWALDPSS
jgi:predicted AAA+ superfamily ATPase